MSIKDIQMRKVKSPFYLWSFSHFSKKLLLLIIFFIILATSKPYQLQWNQQDILCCSMLERCNRILWRCSDWYCGGCKLLYFWRHKIPFGRHSLAELRLLHKQSRNNQENFTRELNNLTKWTSLEMWRITNYE